MRGLEEKAHNVKSTRTSSRYGLPVSLDDFKFRFRIKNDNEAVTEAFENSGFDVRCLPSFDNLLGHVVTFDSEVHTTDESDDTIEIDGLDWPIEALERVI